jgi:integrase
LIKCRAVSRPFGVSFPNAFYLAASQDRPACRISELLALEIGKHINTDCTVLTIKQQRGLKGTIEPPKTKSGFREIDLCDSLAKMLTGYIGDRTSGFLFQTANGTMLSHQNLWEDGFQTAAKELNLDVRFHAFRRFRESVLQASECRELLIRFRMGHNDSDMGSRYGEQLTRDKAYRQEWANKVGLGFDMAAMNPSLLAIRAIRNIKVRNAA